MSKRDVLDDAPTLPWMPITPPSPNLESDLPPLLCVEEVAKLLRINRKSAYAAVESGTIPGVVRIGRSIRVSRILKLLAGRANLRQPDGNTNKAHENLVGFQILRGGVDGT